MPRQGSAKNPDCLVYSVGQDLVVPCHYEIPGIRAQEWTAGLLEGLTPHRVVVLTSFVEGEYRTEDRDPQHRLLPPLLKKLQTKAAASLSPPLCTFLESPAIVKDAGAAVLSFVSKNPLSFRIVLAHTTPLN